MSEIISIHVGGSGSKVGLEYWNQLNSKTKLTKQQEKGQKLPYLHKFYNEDSKSKKAPRAIFVDTDIRTKQFVSKSDINFDKRLLLGQGSSSRNLFSEGRYLSGALLQQQFIQMTRRQAEKCDLLSGFVLMNSPAGGIGSGLGSGVASKLRQYYCATIVENFRIMPGTIPQQKFHNLNPLEIYNIILSTHYAIENIDIIYCMQNAAAQRTLFKRLNSHVNFDQINNYYGKCLYEHVSGYIFPGTLNTNQRKRAVNLIPFPRLKHTCGILNEPGKINCVQSSLENINKLMYHDSPNDHRIFAMNLNVCDQLTSQNELNKIVQSWKNSTDNQFVQWLPNNILMSMRSPYQTAIDQQNTSWTLLNGSNNITWARQMAQRFTAQFRRKAFLHHYIADGMDQMQFVQAQSNCNDLISQYVPCTGCCADEDEEQIYQQ